MPVATTTTVPRGRGRGRGRWAGDLTPSSPGSRTRSVTLTPPSTPVARVSGEKSPPESSSPRDNSVVTSSSTPTGRINGQKTPSLSVGPKDNTGANPAPNVRVQRVQSPNSQAGETRGIPLPPNAWLQKSQFTDQRPNNRREIPQPPHSWVERCRSPNSPPEDSVGVTTPSDVHKQRNPPENTVPLGNRELPQPAKVVTQKAKTRKSRSRNNGDAVQGERTQNPREDDQVTSPADTLTPKTSPQTSRPRDYGEIPSPTNTPQTSRPRHNGEIPSPTNTCVQKVQTSNTSPSGDVPQPSVNVWVQRSQARKAQSTNNGDGTLPASSRAGGKSPSPGQQDRASPGSSRSPSSSSLPASPRERGSEGELPPPPSPRGKDCSASSDSSADDAELEGLVGLPDHVLMYNKRDPVSVLMEYGQTREVKVGFTEMSRSGPHHASRFHTAAIVDGETHTQATGTSKKNAKKAAAILALRTLYDRGMAHLQQGNVTANRELREMEKQPEKQEPLCHGTRVMHVSRRLLEVAEETQFINYSKDKVLAAIVLERRGTYTVVGLGTGNRCIQYQNLPTDGSRVIHSHAEIIARRAFIRYVLKELGSYRGTEKHALFTRSRHTGLLKLHEDIRVHLYISRPPCGDAAAFPTITNFPNRMRAIRKQGQLRTIIDDGEGAIPTEFPLPANANGKERLRVMTCSDKILRWNAVGIQGALLSNFLDPVYLSSVVIGSHTGDQRGHVPRAVSGRLKCGRLHEVLMKPFRICSPEIVYPPHSDNYAITKSKQYCITWSEGDPDAEVIDAVSGSVAMEPTNDSPSSRVSKRTLLALFRQASQNLRANHLMTLTYAEAKAAARAYQRTKKAVEAHLQNCGFGQWLSLQLSYGVDDFQDAEKP